MTTEQQEIQDETSTQGEVGEEQETQETNEDELAALNAGYGRVPGQVPEVEQGDGEEAEETPPAPVIAGLPEPELAARLQKVEQLEQDLNQRFQKVNNQIGNMLQQLRAVTASTPKAEARQITADSMKKLREMGYDEIANALAEDLNDAFQPSQPVDIASAMQEMLKERSRQELAELHPDYREAVGSQEWQEWLSTLPPETRQQVMHSESVPFVSRALDYFKQWHHDRSSGADTAHQETRQRLENAVTPTTGRTAKPPSKLPDEAGLWVGYKAGMKPLNQLRGK
jgi:hypothetical protein